MYLKIYVKNEKHNNIYIIIKNWDIMDLEGSVDCDGSCSGLDSIRTKRISHEQVEKELDEAIKPSCYEKVCNWLKGWLYAVPLY